MHLNSDHNRLGSDAALRYMLACEGESEAIKTDVNVLKS